MTAIELRNLTPGDIAAINDLLESQRDEYVRGFRPFGESPGWLDALEAPGDDVYQGVWLDGMLMGVVMLRGWNEGYDIPALGILVDEAYAGTGVADAVIRMAITTARYRGAQRVMLHVDVDNDRAWRCFERHGFWPVGDAFDGRVRMEATIVGEAEAETDLRTLYDPDIATVRRGIRETYGFTPTDEYCRDFATFAQAKAEELIDV